MKNYINQLNGTEQNAVYCIRKLIANQLNAHRVGARMRHSNVYGLLVPFL